MLKQGRESGIWIDETGKGRAEEVREDLAWEPAPLALASHGRAGPRPAPLPQFPPRCCDLCSLRADLAIPRCPGVRPHGALHRAASP